MALQFQPDFTLGPLRFLDSALLPEAQRRAVFHHHEEMARKIARLARGSKLDLCRFEKRREQAECDYSLPGAHFAMHRISDGDFAGTWALYNIRVERETRRIVRATASPVCHPQVESFDAIARTAARILDLWLQNDAPLEDGRRFDLVAWEFPVGRWEGIRETEILEELGHQVIEREGGRIRRIRR